MRDFRLSDVLDRVRQELSNAGIDLDAGCCDPSSDSPLKVVCVSGGLADSLKEMGRAPRDQVVMARLDEETTKTLDDWIEAGAFKSRSEAAALFIREGLKLHARELQELAEALRGVEQAKDRLRHKAREVFESANGDTSASEGEGTK
jgi:Arc/MetJ-type ribon-helix-helix transcriptional regulator